MHLGLLLALQALDAGEDLLLVTSECHSHVPQLTAQEGKPVKACQRK